jgi:hypothetical protein
VNAEAVAAQKADADDLEVYHLDVKAKALSRVARIDGQKRATAFRLSGGRLGVLRKHKGFGRGGETLEIFELASLRPAPSPRPTDKLAPPVPSDKPVPAASPAATPSPSSSTSPTSKKK